MKIFTISRLVLVAKKINLIFFANIKHKGVYRILSVIYLALFIFTFISISNIVSLKMEYGRNNVDVVVKRAHDLKNEFLNDYDCIGYLSGGLFSVHGFPWFLESYDYVSRSNVLSHSNKSNHWFETFRTRVKERDVKSLRFDEKKCIKIIDEFQWRTDRLERYLIYRLHPLTTFDRYTIKNDEIIPYHDTSNNGWSIKFGYKYFVQILFFPTLIFIFLIHLINWIGRGFIKKNK